MENARLAVFEDEPAFRELIRRVLEGTTHVVVAEATTPDESLELARSLRDGECLADVLLLDGNLSEALPRDGRDVRRIFDVLGRERANFLTINLSLNAPEELGVPFDVDMGKDGIVNRLVGILDSH